jgi:DNA-binding response OmpR family regulator
VLALVAASDPALGAALADAVRAAGHDAVLATDGAAAWDAYLRRRPPLLIVDLDLAPGAAPEGPDGLDALALCRRVRAEAHRGSEDGGVGALPAPDPQVGTPGSTDEAIDEADLEADPFVIVTVPHTGEVDVQAALVAGADDYLATPPTPRNVAARLAIAERRMGSTAARRRAERALSRARWVAGIGETSIALQHEINNPLAALLGHAALLEQGLVEPGEERELLQIVVEQAQRIATVMRRLAALRDPRTVEYFGAARMLDLSRPDPGSAPDAPGADAPGPEVSARDARPASD